MEKRCRAGNQNVVEPKVEDGCEGLAESDNSSADSDDSTRQNIVPVVV